MGCYVEPMGDVELDGTQHGANDAVWLARVYFRSGEAAFSLTSVPHFPPGFVPNILAAER